MPDDGAGQKILIFKNYYLLIRSDTENINF